MAKGRRSNNEGSIYKDKRGLWHGAITVGVTADGKQRRKKVSSKSFDECRRKFRQLVRDFEDGKFDQDQTTFAAAAADWLAAQQHQVRDRTYDIYAGELKYACEFLGEKELVSLTAADVRKMQRTIAEQVGPPTAKKVRDRTWSVLEMAYHDELVKSNVASMVKAVRVSKKKL